MSRRVRLAGTVVALLAMAAAAGCEASPQADEPPGGPPASSTGSGDTDESPRVAPVADPEHAVDPPGPRTGRWAPPDIIVTSAGTIPPDRVASIAALPGVTDVEQVSRVEIPIENRSLTLLAVDPASYRNYVTDVGTAQADQIWGRVAGGELAVRPGLSEQLPTDEQGYVELGSTERAPRVHVGAYATQTWQADAVVNRTWADELDMPEGNALLVRSAKVAPGPLRRPIQRLLRGTDASVQMTDAVARYGLDPDVVQTAVVVGTVADAVGVYRYRVLGGGKIAPDAGWVAEHITTEAVPILGNIQCNKLMFPQLRAALEEIVARGLADEINPGEYAGCYNARFIAGSTTLSNHAFGLALDLNVPGNQRGTVGEMDRDVVRIFKSWGFAWGGDWSWTDPMHFEMNRLVRPD